MEVEVSQPRILAPWQKSLILILSNEDTLLMLVKLPQMRAKAKQWCSSKLAKKTIGTRLLSIIENYTSWRKMKLDKRKCMIRPNCVTFYMNKWNRSVIIVHLKSRKITITWKIWNKQCQLKREHAKKNLLKKGDIFRMSIRNVVNNSRPYWGNGKMTEGNNTTTTMKWWSKIRRRKLRSRISEPNLPLFWEQVRLRLKRKRLRKLLFLPISWPRRPSLLRLSL